MKYAVRNENENFMKEIGGNMNNIIYSFMFVIAFSFPANADKLNTLPKSKVVNVILNEKYIMQGTSHNVFILSPEGSPVSINKASIIAVSQSEYNRISEMAKSEDKTSWLCAAKAHANLVWAVELEPHTADFVELTGFFYNSKGEMDGGATLTSEYVRERYNGNMEYFGSIKPDFSGFLSRGGAYLTVSSVIAADGNVWEKNSISTFNDMTDYHLDSVMASNASRFEEGCRFEVSDVIPEN